MNNINKYKNEILLYNNSKLDKNNSDYYAINKKWLDKWKDKVNYKKNCSKIKNKKKNIYSLIEITNLNKDLQKINNKEILIDINSFLNDGDENNIENMIIKENSYELISKELWESFKDYGFDIELNYKIINQKLSDLVFLYNDNKKTKIQKLESSIYIDEEENLINKIVKCLNLRKNEISSNICLFYNNIKFEAKDFTLNKNKNDKYILSFTKTNKSKKLVLIGLNNLGATCFMNAVLQIFYNIKEFSDYLLNSTNSYYNCPITKALKTVFINLNNPNNNTYSPYEFKNIIGKYNPKFLKNEPNDSRQLIQYILNSIHNELNENKNKNYPYDDEPEEINWNDKLKYEKKSFNYENKSKIIDLFYGIQANETYCYNCKKISYEFEHFNILTLPILPKYNNNININDMLVDYSRKIDLNGKNKNFCEICNGDYDAYTRSILYEAPKILIIHPGRKKEGKKYNIKIDFEEELIIELSDNLTNNKIEYNLIGIIYHIGGNGFVGHNFAYCKINEIWYEFNDSRVNEINFNSITGEGVLLLIYKRKNI